MNRKSRVLGLVLALALCCAGLAGCSMGVVTVVDMDALEQASEHR